MGTDAKVIDLARARLARQCDEALAVARAPIPAIVFGSVELVGDRVVLQADCRLTPDAAERLAVELYRLAGLTREEAERG